MKAAAEKLLEVIPQARQAARLNRAFLRRAVRFCLESGIRQFIDIGSGIPTAGNVHEIAQDANPAARIAYVDIEPIAVAHSEALLAGNPNATVARADLRRPAEVLAHPAVHGLLDFTRPVAVIIVGVMHFIADADDPAGIVAGYRAALASGSYLALSHGTADGLPPAEVDSALNVYRRSPTPLHLRDRATVAGMFAGFDLVEPGITDVLNWRPEDPPPPGVAPFAWGAVGKRP